MTVTTNKRISGNLDGVISLENDGLQIGGVAPSAEQAAVLQTDLGIAALNERLDAVGVLAQLTPGSDCTEQLKTYIKYCYDLNAPSRLIIPAGDFYISGSIFSLIPDDVTVKFGIFGTRSTYGGTRFISSAQNFTMIPARVAGLSIDGITFIGDGGAYGDGGTVTAIDAIGAQVGDQWNLDMNIDNCAFVYLAKGVKQTGKNLRIGSGTIFSNSLNGVTASKNTGASETRGLTIESGVRFHSIGGQNVPAKAIYLDPASDFIDVTIGQVYADDCYSVIEGFAAPIQIVGILGSRNWGGINFDTTGRTISEYAKNQVSIGNLILHFVTDTSRSSDGFRFHSHLDVHGNIGQIDVFNPSGHGVVFSSAANKVMRINVGYIVSQEPGDLGAYDALRIEAEVGGLKVSKAILAKGGSTTTGVGLRTVGSRTIAWGNDVANVFGDEIGIYGFLTANRVSINNPRDYGPSQIISNEFKIQTVTLDQDFSIYVGNNNPIVRLTAAISANRNITIADTNAYDGAKFTIIHAAADANNWVVKANAGATVATLAANQVCDVVWSAAVTDWVVLSKGAVA